MTDVHFYHLTRSSLEQALPEVLEKVLARGWRAVVVAGSAERVESLTQHLWTYRPDSFLPHGDARDGLPEHQPIWITPDDVRSNNAEVLILTDGAASTHLDDYARVCEMFAGANDEALAEARRRWRTYKEQDHGLTYWRQEPKGWVQQT